MATAAIDLGERTKQFALRIIRLCATLPATTEAKVIRGQLCRSGTSVGAQYREARRSRSRSRAEFVSKMESAQQEVDETGYWFELVEGAASVRHGRLKKLVNETEELMAIFAASARTAKKARPA